MSGSGIKAGSEDQTYLTERQKKWFASVRAGLERDTGKTLEEWVAIARTCPETAARKRVDWLREHHGLGVNRAATVLGEAFPGGMGWNEPQALRAALWVDPASRAILEAVETAVARLPEVVTGQRKGFTAWSRKVQFAALRPVKGGVARLGLAVALEAAAGLVAPKNEGWSERLKSVRVLEQPQSVDGELAVLLKQAWEAS